MAACDGYDDYFDRVHRDQSDSIRRKFQSAKPVLLNGGQNQFQCQRQPPKEPPRPFPEVWARLRYDENAKPLALQIAEYDKRLCSIEKASPGRLQLRFEDLARDVFLNVLATHDMTTRVMGGCICWVLPLLAQSPMSSPLHKVVLAAAVNMGVAWSRNRRWSALPPKYYAEAAHSLRLAVADETRCRDDDVLMASLVMDFIDHMNDGFWVDPEDDRPRSHQTGAMALARHRGQANFKSEAGKAMLVTLQNVTVEYALQRGEALSRPFQAFFKSIPMSKNMPACLDALTIKLADLLLRARGPWICGSEDLLTLRREFLQLDNQFVDWYEDFAITSMFRVIKGDKIPASIRRLGVYQDRCSVYVDLEIANCVNIWRYRRILLLAALRNCNADGWGHDNDWDVGIIEYIDATIQRLADEICDCVPFFLGDYNDAAPTFNHLDVTFPSVSDGNKTFPTSKLGHARLATGAGGWTMLAPLTALSKLDKSGSASRPIQLREGQQEWIACQMHRVR